MNPSITWGGTMSRCPECRNAHHINCTGWAREELTLDTVECGCSANNCRGGGGR